MNFPEELNFFLKNIISVAIPLLVLSFCFFFFPFNNSLTVFVFQKIQTDLLPEGVSLIVTNPMSAFIAEIELSLVLAFVVLFPFFIYKITKYLSPALFKKERKLLFQSLLPTSLLFFVGCFFAYYFLIPTTFRILYSYASRIDVTLLFSMAEFISSIFGLMIITGIIFLLPFFMFFLTFLNIVEAVFWKLHLRHFLLFFLIFTAIITPDGTGITMLILFIPLIVLYLLGCWLTQRLESRKICDIIESGNGGSN